MSLSETLRQQVRDRAASYLGKNRSDFVLEIACREAEHVLLDRAYIAVGEETFDRLYQLLDSPPEPSEGLLKLMREKHLGHSTVTSTATYTTNGDSSGDRL